MNSKLNKKNIILILLTIIFSIPKINTAAHWYENKTFILSSNNEFILDPQVEQLAKIAYTDLNDSIFFNTKNIVNSPFIQKEFEKIGGQEVIIETEDHVKLKCSYFDRNKNKILIIAPGLTNAKEKMAPFISMFFDDYDLLILNFRGHGDVIKNKINLNPLNCILQKILEIDLSQIRFGKEEEKDVLAAISFAKNQKEYSSISGLGVCYGALILAKTQGLFDKTNSNKTKLFDNLILDGCWLSLASFKAKIISNPVLIFNPQKGNASPFVRKMFQNHWFVNCIENMLYNLSKIRFDELNVTDYLSEITTSKILMFYGKNDLTISRNEFEEIWASITQAPKLAVITSNEHVWNHLKQKELYKLICKLHLDYNSIETAEAYLNNLESLKSFLKI